MVDDEPDVLLLTRLNLESAGFDVLEARSGEEAVSILAEREPDALLLDIRMPGIGGWGVLEWLQERDLMRRLPVVVVSAHATGHAAARARELGCAAYIKKPFALDELTETVRRAVERENG